MNQPDNRAGGSVPRSGRMPAATASLRRHPWMLALGLLVVAVLVLLLAWDWNWFKGPLERRVEANTGRALEIGGQLDVDLGWVSTISADKVRFGNADWSEQAVMAAADRVEIDIELAPLLVGALHIPGLRLTRPTLLLETGPEGIGNWVFGDDEPSDTQFRRIRITDGRLHFVDSANNTDIRLAISSTGANATGANDGRAPGGQAAPASDPSRNSAGTIVAEGGGRWQGSAFTLNGRADSPLALRNPDSPYRIDVSAQAGATRAHASGTLLDPLQMRDFDLQLELSGQNLADLYPLIGLATPPTPPYTLEGHFTRDGSVWHYDDFSGTVGDSDLAGDASVDTGGQRPYLRADLVSRRLDFDDLAGFVGGAPQAGGDEASNPQLAAQASAEGARQRVLPDTPYRLDKLRAMDADVRWRASHIDASGWPIEDMEAHLLLEDGVLRLDPLDFGVADGSVAATVKMDARSDTITTRADIGARGLELSKLLPEVELAQNAVGAVGGKVALAGTGNSIADMLGSSDGDVLLGMGQGRISNLLMEKAGLDLAEIIKFKLTGDQLIPIRCAFGDFAVEDGIMTARALAFDTTDTILIGTGHINLRDETLDLVIHPRPKDRSLLSLRAPLLVTGTFKNPEITPDLGALGLRGAIALTLGTIAPPAALLATIELGPGENAGCGGEYAK